MLHQEALVCGVQGYANGVAVLFDDPIMEGSIVELKNRSYKVVSKIERESDRPPIFNVVPSDFLSLRKRML